MSPENTTPRPGNVSSAPRTGDTITTAEEVIALPPGSITRDRNGAAWKRGIGSWVSTAEDGDPQDGQPLPATVLYVPVEDARAEGYCTCNGPDAGGRMGDCEIAAHRAEWWAASVPSDHTATTEEPVRLRIEGTWLAREVNYHTCGTGSGGHYGAHEPGCGLLPEVDLSTLPGWDGLLATARPETTTEWGVKTTPDGHLYPMSEQEARTITEAIRSGYRGNPNPIVMCREVTAWTEVPR